MTRYALFAGCILLAVPRAASSQTSLSSDAAHEAVQQPVVGTSLSQNETALDTSAEIIVTAQHRSESLQKVPIAITVVSGDALKANNFVSITDAQYLAPSLKFIETPQQPTFAIRGVGSQAFDYSVESSVGVSLDDVIQTLPRASSLNTLADVERIEVLRGPQGTLFGKNTSAGIISIITRRPKMDRFSTEGHIQYGSRNELQAYDIINVPLTDTLAARFRAAYQVRDPVTKTVSTGHIPVNRDYEFNGKLLWEPSSSFSLYAIGDYQNSSGDPGVFTIRSYGTGTFAPGVGNFFLRDTTTALGIVPSPNNNETAIGTDNYQKSKTYSGQVTGTLALGDQTLTSITAYKHLDYVSQLEADSSPLTVFDTNLGTINAHQFTQELRLSSPAGKTVEYTVGGFYYNQELTSTQLQAGGLGFLPNDFATQIASLGGRSNYGLSVKNYAAFGELTIRPVDRLRLIGGLRYTHDSIKSSVFISAVPGVCGFEFFGGVCHAAPLPSPTATGSTSRGAVTGRGGAEFDVAPDVMAYATVSRGYKGGGIATVSAQLHDVLPETVWSEEVGVKSQFLDRKLTLNLALFHSKYKNFQTEVFDPTVPPQGAFVTGNAGGLRTQGVEVEASGRPIAGLTLSGGITYIDAKFTNYHPACYDGQTAAQGCTLPGPTFDASGTGLPNAPRWTYTLSAGYETPEIRGVKGFLNTNYSYRSSVLYGVGNPATTQSAYGLWNLSVGIGDPDGRARLSVFARNLLDKRFAATLFPTFFDAGGITQVLPDAAFRRVGVALDFRF